MTQHLGHFITFTRENNSAWLAALHTGQWNIGRSSAAVRQQATPDHDEFAMH